MLPNTMFLNLSLSSEGVATAGIFGIIYRHQDAEDQHNRSDIYGGLEYGVHVEVERQKNDVNGRLGVGVSRVGCGRDLWKA